MTQIKNKLTSLWQSKNQLSGMIDDKMKAVKPEIKDPILPNTEKKPSLLDNYVKGLPEDQTRILQNGIRMVKPPLGRELLKNGKTVILLDKRDVASLDNIVNVYYGVKAPTQYRFTVQELTENQDQSRSQTKHVQVHPLFGTSVYHQGLNIIDTPGFDDTSGIQRDREIKRELEDFILCNLFTIDFVGYVIPASQPRLTDTQVYIYDNVLSLLGKDLKASIACIFTFADGGIATSEAALRDIGLNPHYSFPVNNSVLFEQMMVPNEAEKDTRFKFSFWETNRQNVSYMLQVLHTSFPPRSLALSKTTITSRRQILSDLPTLKTTLYQQLKNMTALSEAKTNLQHQSSVKPHSHTRTITHTPKHRSIYCKNCNQTCFIAPNVNSNIDKAARFLWDEEWRCGRCLYGCLWRDHLGSDAYVDFVGQEPWEEDDEVLVKGLGKDVEECQQMVDVTLRELCDRFSDFRRRIDKLNDDAMQEFIWTETGFLEECELDGSFAKHQFWNALVFEVKNLLSRRHNQNQAMANGGKIDQVGDSSQSNLRMVEFARDGVGNEGGLPSNFQHF
eukprot:CAMPEP_0114992500 /NCGR_PEP_ID=MMETSP0216-20121206/11977_1 /TAXON_ID=223996 /ORGANISM="Protocruzia adherens, Strain Boccale" /LENGTH=560 /DNA_ID=CAMNT_0002355975 /DNA_START=115 /DNA_END=1798 /DNA_ORIENTATION=-